MRLQKRFSDKYYSSNNFRVRILFVCMMKLKIDNLLYKKAMLCVHQSQHKNSKSNQLSSNNQFLRKMEEVVEQ